MFLDILLIVVGLGVLILGAEGLVRGASSLAAKLDISPLVIGLTVVSFGTSAPELTVNLLSVINGSPDLALGNIVGSNISNILLILGISAMIIPLKVKSSTVWREIPFALLGVFLLFVMVNDRFLDGSSVNALTRTDGIALLSLMVIFMYYIFGRIHKKRSSKQEKTDAGDDEYRYSTLVSTLLVIGGSIGLVLGGKMLVSGSISIATNLGMSEALVGLTIVAVGTSLPELATSVVAAIKNKVDIAVGNVVGSNIFNIFFVLGVTSLIAPLSTASSLNVDIAVSIIATLLLLLFMFVDVKKYIVRTEGVILLAFYVAYLVFIVIRG